MLIVHRFEAGNWSIDSIKHGFTYHDLSWLQKTSVTNRAGLTATHSRANNLRPTSRQPMSVQFATTDNLLTHDMTKIYRIDLFF